MTFKIILVCLGCFAFAIAQENAGTSISKSLLMCYQSTEYFKSNVPPTSINILIELIRKLEDGKDAGDPRKLSFQLLHRFRQDGIRKSKDAEDNPYVIAYSPTEFPRYKNIILLQTLIPGDARMFPNETLSELEQCAFHLMISNTVLVTKRGDEGNSCSRVGRYVQRFRRDTEPEAEVADTRSLHPERTLKEDVSECPLEFGAIYTKWGAVQAGTLLAGIAAGYEKQMIPQDGGDIDSLYAATLTGDIAETALHQVKGDKVVGRQGTWNSTLVPRYYFIEKQSDEKYEFTDAEIRAGLDGIILGTKINAELKNKAIKISQILDLYYSNRGVLSTDIRACNRKTAYANLISVDELKKQALLFSKYYDDKTQLPYTVKPESIEPFTNAALDKFIAYLDQINDPICKDQTERAATDLIIVLDTNWRYQVIQPAIANLLDQVDLNRFGSNVTIINGADGGVILKSTNSLLEFHENYNLTTHTNHPAGFNFKTMMTKAQNLIKSKMNEDKKSGTIGGRSTIVLFAPVSAPAGSDNTESESWKERNKGFFPDMKVLVLGQASKDSYKALVTSISSDVYTLKDATDEVEIGNSIENLARRIKQIPRIIKNSQCGADWTSESQSKSFEQYVEPGTTNYYKIAPQYFYGEGDRSVKVRGAGSGQLTVCWSNDFSKINGQNKGTCKTINNDEYTISLTNKCNTDESLVNCQSIYISVNANSTKTTSNNVKCSDKNCRFPDNLKYTIATDALTCVSGSIQYLANILLISLSMFVLTKLNIF